MTPVRKHESRGLDDQDAASILPSTRLPAHAAHGVDMASKARGSVPVLENLILDSEFLALQLG